MDFLRHADKETTVRNPHFYITQRSEFYFPNDAGGIARNGRQILIPPGASDSGTNIKITRII